MIYIILQISSTLSLVFLLFLGGKGGKGKRRIFPIMEMLPLWHSLCYMSGHWWCRNTQLLQSSWLHCVGVFLSAVGSWSGERVLGLWKLLGDVGIGTGNIMDQKTRSLGLVIWNLDVSIDPASQFVLILYDVFCSAWASHAAYLAWDSSSLSEGVKLEV